MSRDRWMAVNYCIINNDKYISKFQQLLKWNLELKHEIKKYKRDSDLLPGIEKEIQICENKIKELSGV